MSLSIDLDNQWCFMQTNGDDGWQGFPTYLPDIVPRILSFFDEYDQPITFFIVGVDATKEQNRSSLASISKKGHEIASHSFLHQPWLHTYSVEEIKNEFQQAEDAIQDVTGVLPRGFRGPGYSYSKEVLEVLASRNYAYDCSSFPNSLAGLSRMYFFARNSLNKEERSRRSGLFGRSNEMLRTIRPYVCRLQSGRILEIPVTTMPFFRFPIHFSYVLYLSEYSEKLAIAYFRAAMALCEFRKIGPSLLFHPLDFMGSDDDCKEVAFFPGMNRTAAQKITTLRSCMAVISSRFQSMPIGRFADLVRSSDAIPQSVAVTLS
jgi:hypothetical protein